MKNFFILILKPMLKIVNIWMLPLILAVLYSLFPENNMTSILILFIGSFLLNAIWVLFYLIADPYYNYFTYCVKSILFFLFISLLIVFSIFIFKTIYYHFPALYEHKIIMVLSNSFVTILLLGYFYKFFNNVKAYYSNIDIEFTRLVSFFRKHDIYI